MQVHLYTLCWNEREYLPHFFARFDPVVDRYVIYDDGSDDGSLDLLSAHPKVELRRFARRDEGSFVRSHQGLQNEVWRESLGQADWVIVTAIDEHLVLPGDAPLRPYLAECAAAGITAIPAIGFQMVGDRFPADADSMFTSVPCGAPKDLMNKLSIFAPDHVSPNFGAGRHRSYPQGRVAYPAEDRLMLLHYKMVDFDRTLARQQQLRARMGAGDREKGWGRHYERTRLQLSDEWSGYLARALDVTAPDFRPSAHSDGAPWWRDKSLRARWRKFRNYFMRHRSVVR